MIDEAKYSICLAFANFRGTVTFPLMEEILDVLSPSGNPTGEVVPKSEAHRRGLYHRCFHCWVCDPAGGRLLAQRRSAAKKTWPGRLDTTAAGHLSSGEGILDGLRELEEELGLRVSPERLIPLGRRRVEKEHPEGYDRELHGVFLLLDTTPPAELELQREEVESVVSIRLEDVERLYEGEEIEVEEFVNGEELVTYGVSLGDFVPNEDFYLLRVAQAARGILSGREPERVF
jgi:isopentenyldiphosphate isomerase